MFAGTYYWFPKMFGRMMNERWGTRPLLPHAGRNLRHLHADALSGHGGAAAALFAVHRTGLLSTLIPLNTFITYAAIVTIAAQFIFVINLFWSMFKGPKASDNPWEATTLEWTTATPPPHDNFGGKTPVVHNGARTACLELPDACRRILRGAFRSLRICRAWFVCADSIGFV